MNEARIALGESAAKNQQLKEAAEKEVTALREEYRNEKEQLQKDSSKKIADLGEQIKGMLAATED
uniref:hypothetical protein n=1 Tax=Escherichia coli TaxID=562 RepID=UPI00200D21FF